MRSTMPPLVAIGTTNPGKVLAVKDAFSAYTALDGSSFAPFKVKNTGVSEQPMSLVETVTGAKNRASAAWGATQTNAGGGPCGGCAGSDSGGGANDNHWGVGMESGLFEGSQGKLYDICACAIFDGANYHVGYSCAWALPDAVAEVRAQGQSDLGHYFSAGPQSPFMVDV